MRYFYQNNQSKELIVFFAGWGCDENQFTNLQDNKDVLILYDYQDLELDFEFSRYNRIDVIAYSAGKEPTYETEITLSPADTYRKR